MSDDIALNITRTRKAIARAKAAVTTLGQCGAKPEHRELMAKLHAVVEALETELRALRYAARHQKAAAA